MNVQNYRLYCVSLYQLSDKHAGVQNNHSTEKMLLTKWFHLKELGIIDARLKDQTAIFLSGGTSDMLTDQIARFKELNYSLIETFEEPDLYGKTTSYSVYIPQHIVDVKLPRYKETYEEYIKFYEGFSLSQTFEEYVMQYHNIDLEPDEIKLKYIINDLPLL